jgi:nucleotide-binding universal stress UspA family protein
MRVLVLFEPGRGGLAALDEACELALNWRAALTVVGVAPQARSGQCTGPAAGYNDAVADTVVMELEQARKRLGEFGVDASYRLLIERTSPSLDEFAANGGFDLVLLPARRRPFRAAGHPAAKQLSGACVAEVRVIDARRAAAAD